MNIGAVGLSALSIAGTEILSAIMSAAPRRAIIWQPEDSAGAPVLDADGQPATASVIPQVVVEEQHVDQLRLTQHPVEAGAQITDHAFRLPAKVRIRAASSFAAGASSFPPIIPAAMDGAYLNSIYETLLGLQSGRQIVSLVTGKRLYSNLLLESLSVRTDEKSENVLSFTAEFQEVLIARTQVVAVPSTRVMKSPEATGASTDQGNTALQPAPSINKGAANAVPGAPRVE